MKKLTESELQDRYNKFVELLENTFSGDRLDKLKEMYSQENLGLRLITAPASGYNHWHNAYVGGYIDHIMNVVHACKGMKMLYMKMGGTIDFTDEEMMFAAIHHDLGKLGTDEHEYYNKEHSDWHREHLGRLFVMNPDIQFMNVPERALYILQLYGIVVTEKEWLGIKLADGLYSSANTNYFMTSKKEYKLKTNLPYILHWADHMAATAELDSSGDRDFI